MEGPALEREYGQYVAGLDLGTVNDRTVLAIGHRDGDRVLLDRMQCWQGSRKRPVDFAEVEQFIVASHQRFGFSLRLDPWQGLDLAQRLRGQGVRAEEFTFSSASKQRLAAGCGSNGVTWDISAERHKSPANSYVMTRAGRRFIERNRGHSGGPAASDRAVAFSKGLQCALTLPKIGP